MTKPVREGSSIGVTVVRKPEVPDVKNDAWCQSPVDKFIVAKLEGKGITPNVPADKRTLIRRGLKAETTSAVTALASEKTKPLASRVAAVFALKQALGEKSHDALVKLTADATIAPWALRALTDREDQLANVPVQPALAALASAEPSSTTTISKGRPDSVPTTWAPSLVDARRLPRATRPPAC